MKIKKTKKYWIKYILNRIKNNKNFLGFISGPTGSGKSYTSLSIGQQLDPSFDVDRVVFSGIELMDLINSDKVHSGSVIIFEESGVEMSNRNWQSKTNKMLNFLCQTFRHRNFILIFNSPYMDFVDSATRKLFHAELSTMGIDFKTQEVKLKPHVIQYNSRLKKFYYKRLKVWSNGSKVPINVWRVGLPTQDLIVKYEVKKKEFTDNLNKLIYDELLSEKNKTIKTTELTELQKEYLECLKEGNNIEETAEHFGVIRQTVASSMGLMKKKGYRFTAIKDGSKVLKYEVVEPDV